MAKRKAPGDDTQVGQTQGTLIVAPKKARTQDVMVRERKDGGSVIVSSAIARTSALLAPNMKLQGHGGHVFAAKFNNEGTHIASGGHDRLVYLWNTYGECDNTSVLKGHTNSILDLWWGQDGDLLFTASADKSGAVYDLTTGERIKKFRQQTAAVNSVVGNRRGRQLVATGSDDCTALIYDLRQRLACYKMKSDYQVLSTAFSDDSSQLFVAGIDDNLHCYELRTEKVLYSLKGHGDAVTGIRLSPDGSYLLSTSRDNTMRSWDVRPFVSKQDRGKGRAVAAYQGHCCDVQNNLLRCAWSADGSKVTSGSADYFVYIWDAKSTKILYKLPGHRGSVNAVDFHPQEPIILSGASDKILFLGEIL
eukprot:gb/GEZN01005353.1/.p1 GENE.gb/GEZN01005353.1/~~gb/GEZN01005353.1/.p1  ORF type:complete len:363 (+),score=39.32 gb/GEZN01005353.1/:37-1125(+)